LAQINTKNNKRPEAGNGVGSAFSAKKNKGLRFLLSPCLLFVASPNGRVGYLSLQQAVNSVTLSAFFSTLSTRTVSHIGKSNESWPRANPVCNAGIASSSSCFPRYRSGCCTRTCNL